MAAIDIYASAHLRRSLGRAEDQGTEVATIVRDPQRTCPLRARSAGQRRELTVNTGQPDTPAHLRTGKPPPTRPRPPKLLVILLFRIRGPGM